MPRTIDGAPISVTRSHQSVRFEIQFAADGTLVSIIAHRWLYTRTGGGVDVVPPQYLGSITLVLADFSGAQKTQLNSALTMVEGIVDPKDAVAFP